MSDLDIKKRIGVLTSGGDAPGMNAALRAIVRHAVHLGAEVFFIKEGYIGLVQGGDHICPAAWEDVSDMLQRGGTKIGAARSKEFKEESGQLKAALNLLEHGIDRLIVIGGDGSLTGAQVLFSNWPTLVEKLTNDNRISKEIAGKHPHLSIIGLIGSIDNDVYGSDLTIGVDTALRRILDAVDAINSTASSHQRTFVVEVMGNKCGYLALMSALMTGADWVLIPENPPRDSAGGTPWEDRMCEDIKTGRKAGRRAAIVIMAEGATNADGQKITSSYIKDTLEKKLDEDVRVTILGHVQRGGSPSAYDRNMSTILGYNAAEKILSGVIEKPMVIGLRGNIVTYTEITEALDVTREISEALKNKEYDRALNARGEHMKNIYNITHTLFKSKPNTPPKKNRFNFAVLHCGTQAPGMNTAVRVLVRLALDQGHRIFGIRDGFNGLITNDPNSRSSSKIIEMDWMKVNGWASVGGAELGTNLQVPKTPEDFQKIAQNLAKFNINGLVMIGGWNGYQTAFDLFTRQGLFKEFRIPIVCVPATISNRLPGTEVSIGADTALNNIVEAVDKIKQSAVGLKRCFVTEVGGRYCGYLALMSGLATGAERVYLPEYPFSLKTIQEDLDFLVSEFREGRKVASIIKNENSHASYNTIFLTTLLDQESKGFFDARPSILGHLQEGGSPSPFDRILATRLASAALDFLLKYAGSDGPFCAFLGINGRRITENNLNAFPAMVDTKFERPLNPWWLKFQDIVIKLACKPKDS